MRMIGNFNDTTCIFTFSHGRQLYAVVETDRPNECVCVKLSFHFWHGYRYTQAGVSEDMRRITDKILALAERSPEKYRMQGEHYEVDMQKEDGVYRYRIRKERPISSSLKARALPLLFHLLFLLLSDAFVLMTFQEISIAWFSYFFPSLSLQALYIVYFLTELFGSLLIFYIFSASRDALSIYFHAYLPIGLVVMIGLLNRWKIGIFFLLLLALIGFVCLIYMCKHEKHRLKWRDHVYRVKNILCFAVCFCFVITFAFHINPSTYESEGASEITVSQEELSERYHQACAALAYDHFIALTPDERIEVLQTICDYECIVGFGCNSAVLRSTEIIKPMTLGYYEDEFQTITLDRELLRGNHVEKLVETALHEARHHYQYRLIDLYRAVQGNLTEDNRNMAPFREAKAFLLNFQDYQETETDGYAAYYEQLVEQDSRAFAEKRMRETYLYYIYP